MSFLEMNSLIPATNGTDINIQTIHPARIEIKHKVRCDVGFLQIHCSLLILCCVFLGNIRYWNVGHGIRKVGQKILLCVRKCLRKKRAQRLCVHQSMFLLNSLLYYPILFDPAKLLLPGARYDFKSRTSIQGYTI